MRRVLLVLAMVLGARAASAACDLTRLAEVPVDIQGRRGLRPVVTATINGVEGRFLFDTGGANTFLAEGALAKYGLSTENAATVQMKSFGQYFDVKLIIAKEIGFAAWSFGDAHLTVVGEALVTGTDGALGEPQMTDADMEIDLPHHAIRFFQPSDCTPLSLAYWAKPGQAHSIELDPFTADHNRIFGPVAINGVTFRALFDTGASDTGLTRKTAEAAGVHPGDAGVADYGFVQGVGPTPLKNWRSVFSEFSIGGETVAHPILQFSDKTNASADLLIGADFFRRHRVYIAKHQHIMAFTDEGIDSFGIDWDKPPTAAAETAPAAARP